jgi:hypothetical protein
MTKRLAALLTILFCATAFTTETSSASSQNGSSNVETADLNHDLERMNSLLLQMQKNAAFVSHGDTPLKHQFELEIEMWQILIQDMQKKINASEAR